MTTRPEVFSITVDLVDGKPPLSLNDRLHWGEKFRRTSAIRNGIGWQAKAAKIGRRDHIVVQLHFVPPDRRRRDPSNLMATQKPAVDGLVDAGVVRDDTPQYVTELMPVLHEPGSPRMWLEVRPAPGPLTPDDLRWIAEDVRHERAADAADTGGHHG